MSNLFDLAGKVAIVTGGSRGLGCEIVQCFAKNGANLVIASRKEEACTELADRISSETGVRAVGIGAHVGRWEECDMLIDRAYSSFGHVEILVNNAGMSPPYSSLDAVSEDLWDKVMSVNLKGAFRLTALIGPMMAVRNGGSIINISSVSAARPMPSELPYSTAKAGLNALTIGAARAFGPTVRVNAIMAGPFLTDISQSWKPEFKRRLVSTIPLGRIGEPREIAGAALYFASDASSYTTGAVLKVDGGRIWSPA